MKRTLTLALVAIFSICAMAQKPSKEERKLHEKQQMEQLTAQYITTFALDSVAADRFSKIFRDYNKKLREVNRYYSVPKFSKDSTLTDEQLDAVVFAKFDRQRAILEMREFYYRKFRTVLSAKQVKTILDDEKARKAHMKEHMKEHPQHKQSQKTK